MSGLLTCTAWRRTQAVTGHLLLGHCILDMPNCVEEQYPSDTFSQIANLAIMGGLKGVRVLPAVGDQKSLRAPESTIMLP